MPGLAPEILDALCSASAAAWPVLGLVAGLLIVRLRYECSRRAAVEQELQESESRYRAIFETAVDAIIVSDQHGIIQEFSRAAEAMTGYRAAELIGQNMRVLLPPAMRQEPERYTARYLWTIKELEVCRKDGSVFPAHLSIAEWWAGGYRHFTGILRDLSAQHREQIERTKLEAQLHQAQKMEAIGNLTGGMAHDFNNMLGVIIGNIDLLRDLKGEDSDIDELTREALDATFRGADLTRRLLAFARQQPLRPQHVDVNELVSGITRLLRRTIGEDVEISLDLAPELWPVVVDPAQLEASLTNLATNARDAMADGGRLMIVTGNRTLDADYAAQHAEVVPGGYVMLEVSDTGSGMTPEVMHRIFEPFFTTKSRDKGTGLGLSMVFGFIKQSGGHIGVYSEPGIGTTFRLFLPRMTEDVPAVEESGATPLLHGRGESVLVVEDNAALRRVVTRQLGELGYRVLAAENAAAGLELLDRQSIDLLLTDIVMPGGINGRELARRARQRWPGIKIVFTSGFSEARLNGDAGPLAACTPLLSKPYRKEDLASAAREALDRVA
jgi:two-component system, chemotaxis family, CheB/CheR fusion protein